MKFLFAFFILLSVSALPARTIHVIEVEVPFSGSKLFVPNDGQPHPGILALHGSEGGSVPYNQIEGQFWAAHGYAVLTFCWYNCNKSPLTSPVDTIEKVDLNQTQKAFHWLKESQYVQGKKAAIYGVSRGAEQTLILGEKMANDPVGSPDALAVHAPSDVVVTGFTWASLDKRCWICTSFDLSCFNQAENPLMWDWTKTRWNPSCGTQPRDPSQGMPDAWLWNGTTLVTDSRIEIEKFQGPVFLSHGTQDEFWSHTRTLNIQKTLEAAGKKPEVHIFIGEKHVLKTKAENDRRQYLLNYFDQVLR